MHRKWLYYRHKLFRYREVEQALAAQPNVRLLLDIGCGDGEYLLRFRHLPIVDEQNHPKKILSSRDVIGYGANLVEGILELDPSSP